MPYCEAYNGNGQCSQGHNPKNDCLTSTCWFKYWTSAERAGLKALGRRLLLAIHYKAPATIVLESAIKEYVAAARKSKED